jgi:hypothetical protein
MALFCTLFGAVSPPFLGGPSRFPLGIADAVTTCSASTENWLAGSIASESQNSPRGM